MNSDPEYPDYREYKKPVKKRNFFYAYLFIFGTLLGVILTNTFRSSREDIAQGVKSNDSVEQQSLPETNTTIYTEYTDYENAVISATQKAKPAVVSIYASGTIYYRFRDPFWDMFYGLQRQDFSAMGSGVIIDPDGTIITNEHVINRVKDSVEAKIKVELADGRSYDAKIVRDFTAKDIAILSIEGRNFPHIEIGSSAHLSQGQTVLAIGNPFGISAGGEPTVTRGIVSSTSRNFIYPEGKETKYYHNMIQTDASINEGNSGGPLIDLNGKMIGINTAIYSKDSGGSIGISFAIPSDQVKLILESVEKYGEDGDIRSGIKIQSLTVNITNALNFRGKGGVLISGVEPGSPGEKGGVKKGDIITSINEFSVYTIEDVQSIFRGAFPGEVYKLEIFREGVYMELTLKLE